MSVASRGATLGTYELNVFSKLATEPGTYSSAVTYSIVVDVAMDVEPHHGASPAHLQQLQGAKSTQGAAMSELAARLAARNQRKA